MHLELLIVIVVNTIPKGNAFISGARLGDFPTPDFQTTVTLSTQDDNSFVEVIHGLQKTPFHVRVYASSNDGDNVGFKFEGTGVCQNDGLQTERYGGVLFAYNSKTIRVWAPTHTSTYKMGAVIFVGQGWGGNKFSQSSLEADVTIEAWKNGPSPTFQTTIDVDASSKPNETIYHKLKQLPELVSVRVSSNTEDAYFFHATSSVQMSSNPREYGGVLFAYNEKKIVLWTPNKVLSTPRNKVKTGCTLVGKRWGKGKFAAEVSSKACKIHIRLWLNSFPLPVFQSNWQTYFSNMHADSFIEIKHDLRMLPTYVKVQYRFVNSPDGLVFEGTGSVQSTMISGSRYGGIVFAYDKNSVRLWLPSSGDATKSFVIFVGDGWGNKFESISANSALVRVQVFLDRCSGSDKIVDAQNFCRDVSHVSLAQQMGRWDKCSSTCGDGIKTRSIKACEGKGMRSIFQCSFTEDFCGFASNSWTRTSGALKGQFTTNTQVPVHGPNENGYFVYSNLNVDIAMNGKEGYLSGPELRNAKGCVLMFKYASGYYFGSLSVELKTSRGVWLEAWVMEESESLGVSIWLNGYLNIGDTVYEIQQFRFKHEPSRNSNTKIVALTDILLQCESLDEYAMSAEECKGKQEILPSCVVDVFNPYSKGPAWSETKPKNDQDEPAGTYVTADGNVKDLIAKYRFHVMQSGIYLVWIDGFAMDNKSNGVTVEVSGEHYDADPVYNSRNGLWFPINKEFNLQAGTHYVSLIHREQNFQYRNLMLAPKHISVWGDLGMQTHHIPDSNFRSLSSPDKTLGHSRLNAKAGWAPTDKSKGRFYLEIRLPDIALINKIATQGGMWTGQKYCNCKKYKIKFSLDGKNFVYYRISNKKEFEFEGNTKERDAVVEHFFAFALVGRALRIYPTEFDDLMCLRVELYGHYITKGMCPEFKRKTRERRCTGDKVCPLPTQLCQFNEAANRSECLCNNGRHGHECQFACTPNPCLHGSCVMIGVNVSCVCEPGYFGRVCESPCPKGRYGNNCREKCECPGREYCNAVSGECLCLPGVHGDNCSQACNKSAFGQDCAFACNCSEYETCDRVTGECYCKEGFSGVRCSTSCADNTFGRSCNQTCDCFNGARCNATDGRCECKPGFYGRKCRHPCEPDYYGDYCKEYCHHPVNSTCDPITGIYTCVEGLSGPFCNVPCVEGRYGRNCENVCGCNVTHTTACHPRSGVCHCKNGYTGSTCSMHCPKETWGEKCSHTCKCKNGATCAPVTGNCTCLSGYTGANCDNECEAGRYGDNCTRACNCTINTTGTCDHSTGYCNCFPGYQGKLCTDTCTNGRWGINCLEICHCLNNATCDHKNGFCYCPPGYQGVHCRAKCDSGFYGESCLKECSCKNHAHCHHVNGSCNCGSGFTGTFCQLACPQGTYGNNCNERCSCVTMHTLKCSNVNGFCSCKHGYHGNRCAFSCTDGFYGERCLQRCQPCRHVTSQTCDKREGNCSCANGFTGVHCENDCDWTNFGHHCSKVCACSDDEFCNNMNGECHLVSRYLARFKLRVSASFFREPRAVTNLRKDLEMIFEELFVDNTYTARVYKILPLLTKNGEVSEISFSLSNSSEQLPAKRILETFAFIGARNISKIIGYEYYAGETYPITGDEVWYKRYMLHLILGVVGVFLLLCLSGFLFKRHQRSIPSQLKKIKKKPKDIELKPCLANNVGHVYSFENPYYDVIAAMGLEDDIEEDYMNPLYMMENSDLDEYHDYFVYDKDSGVNM